MGRFPGCQVAKKKVASVEIDVAEDPLERTEEQCFRWIEDIHALSTRAIQSIETSPACTLQHHPQPLSSSSV